MAEFIYNNIFNIVILIVLCWFLYYLVKGAVKLMVFFCIMIPCEVVITLLRIVHILNHDPIKESNWYKRWYGQKEFLGADYTEIDRDWGYYELQKKKKDHYTSYLQPQLREELLNEK